VLSLAVLKHDLVDVLHQGNIIQGRSENVGDSHDLDGECYPN